MKIGFIFSDLDKAEYTGQPRIGYHLVQCARSRGHRVSIVSNFGDPAILLPDLNGIETLLVPGKGSLSTYLAGLPRIFRFLYRQHLDYLLVHGALLAVFMRPFAALLRVPMIVSSCEVVDMHPPLLQWAISSCFGASERGVVTAEIIREQLRERGVPNGKVEVAQLGLRREYVPADVLPGVQPCDVLFWGDSKRDRGFDIIVRLAKTLPELRFRALLRWQGAECAHDLAQFDALPNTETLIYPYILPLSTYISAARLVLLPFRFMGVRPPLSLLEAMAMGKCVVTTPMAGNDEVIRHGETGFLVDFDRDWDTALTLLVELAGNHDRRECVGRAAQGVAEQIRHNSCEGLELFKALEGAMGPSSQP